jgi:hypothetical protein
VKERFIIPESKVPSLMAGVFDLHGEVKRLRDKGASLFSIDSTQPIAVSA